MSLDDRDNYLGEFLHPMSLFDNENDFLGKFLHLMSLLDNENDFFGEFHPAEEPSLTSLHM